MRQKTKSFLIRFVWIFFLVFFISSATALTQLEAGTSFYEDFDDELNGRTPLILIHGIHGKESDWSSFTDFFYYRSEQDFGLDLEKLYKLYFFTYDSNKISVEEIGEALRNSIDFATQNNEVIDDVPFVILAHSMGGLVSRAFLQKNLTIGEWTNHFAGERVVRLITLGTPHHGSPAASSLSAYQKCLAVKPSWFDFLFLSNNIYWCSRGFKYTDDSSCLTWDEYNRKDLLWDDYDGGFNYDFEDINDWLLELNDSDLYRSKLIAYYSAIDQNDPLRQSIITCLDLCSLLLIPLERELCALSCVSPALPVFPQRWQLTVASAIMGETLDYVENDGMVPLGSGSLEGYSDLAGRRYLADFSHGEIKGDELETDSVKYFELFDTLKSDLESLFQGISISPENPRVPVEVTFNTKDNGYFYEWQIEDPDNSVTLTGPQVSHVFRKEGTYLITLTTTDDNGATYPSQRSVKVHGPRIDVEYDDNDDYIIRFQADNNASLITFYEWDFGDGSEPSYIADPVHEYMMNGSYDVSLTLTLDDGSTVTGSTLVPIGDGPTYVTGTLRNDITWRKSGGPYIVENLSIAEGATLTIEPGTAVKVEKGLNNWIDVRGTLLAQGTAEAPIIFTSLLDDAYGGDTNGDGDATSPAPGDWAGIEFDGYYGSGTGTLEHCVIRYGGTSASHAGDGIISYGNLSIRQSSPIIRSCEITHSAEHGIYVYDNANPLIENCTIGSNALTGVFITDSSYPTILHNTFQNNGGIAIDAQSFDHLEEIRDNTFSGNGQNGLNLTGTLSRDTVFYDTTPIIIQELSVAEGATLTIEPGTVVKIEKGIYNWIDVRGTLLAQGTAEAPIIFTSLLDDAYGGDTNGDGDATSPAPGDWAGIEFDGYYGSGTGTLEHCVIRYGGTRASYSDDGIISYGNLSIRQSSPTIRFCEITHSAEHGIYVYDNANPLIENCTIGSNALTGVFITDSSYPTIIHNTFQDNVGNAIDAQSFDHLEEIRDNTFSGNGQNGLNLTGILNRDTMFYSTTPIIIQELSIDEGATLTIEPGTVVKIEKGIYNWIDVRGTLLAQGTAEAPIIFTSLLDDAYGGDTNGDGDATSPAPGDWAGIEFDGYYGSGTGTLEHCLIRYGGTSASLGGAGIISYGNLTIRQSSPTIRSCEITHSAEHGIYIYNNANPLIENSVFSQNANYGVGIFSNSSPTIRECTIAWNDTYGVYNNDGTPTLVNSIIWYNNTDLHQVPYDMISYCNTGDSNLAGADGNISAPPLFAPDGYHLTQNSPCVDAGTWSSASISDIDGHDRPYGDGIDMGADEWQGEHYCRSDFNIDGTVDGIDLIVFALDFGKTTCYRNCKGDFDGDGDTDGSDLTTFTIDYRRTDCP